MSARLSSSPCSHILVQPAAPPATSFITSAHSTAEVSGVSWDGGRGVVARGNGVQCRARGPLGSLASSLTRRHTIRCLGTLRFNQVYTVRQVADRDAVVELRGRIETFVPYTCAGEHLLDHRVSLERSLLTIVIAKLKRNEAQVRVLREGCRRIRIRK